MNILFWNLNRKDILESVASLTVERDVDVLILAENTLHPMSLIRAVNGRTKRFLSRPVLQFSSRVEVFTRLPRESVQAVSDMGDLSVWHLVPPLGQSILLIAAHLPSKLHQSDIDQAMLAARLPRLVDQAEAHVGHSRTVLVGDLNMNPFEHGVVASEGLHGVMTRTIAARQSRVVHGQERKFFYNPMWSRFGERPDGAGGTYYYEASGSPVSYFWNIFDQVLIRPSLLDAFNDEELEIVTEIGSESLLRNDKPDSDRFSDHLPLFFRVDEMKGWNDVNRVAQESVG